MASLADLQAERERLKAANAKAEFNAALKFVKATER